MTCRREAGNATARIEAWLDRRPPFDSARLRLAAAAATPRSTGFTLLEVLAAVLVLGLVYTMLAEAAIIGLRSEGIDRRRAEASLLADRELAWVEGMVATGLPLESGLTTREEEPYRISVEVLPEDVLSLMPPAPETAVPGAGEEELATLLVDERGESRLQRLRVAVEWDEGAESESVERITWIFDTSELAALFPEDGGSEAGGAEAGDGEPSLAEQLGGEVPPELQELLKQAEGGR